MPAKTRTYYIAIVGILTAGIGLSRLLTNPQPGGRVSPVPSIEFPYQIGNFVGRDAQSRYREEFNELNRTGLRFDKIIVREYQEKDNVLVEFSFLSSPSMTGMKDFTYCLRYLGWTPIIRRRTSIETDEGQSRTDSYLAILLSPEDPPKEKSLVYYWWSGDEGHLPENFMLLPFLRLRERFTPESQRVNTFSVIRTVAAKTPDSEAMEPMLRFLYHLRTQERAKAPR